MIFVIFASLTCFNNFFVRGKNLILIPERVVNELSTGKKAGWFEWYLVNGNISLEVFRKTI